MPAKNPYDRPFWIGAVVVIVLLFALFFVPTSYALPSHALGWIVGAILICAVLGAQLLSWKQGLWELKRSYTLEVNEGKLIQRRAGSATLEIPFNEIESLRQAYGWIEVKSGKKSIMVPPGISGFDDLKTELGKYGPITPVKSKTRWLSWMLTLIMISACILIFTSHQGKVIEISGAVILITQASWIFPLGRRLWARRKAAVILLLFYVVSLLLLGWFIFQRVKAIS